jgi:hypothetical protein
MSEHDEFDDDAELSDDLFGVNGCIESNGHFDDAALTALINCD